MEVAQIPYQSLPYIDHDDRQLQRLNVTFDDDLKRQEHKAEAESIIT